LYHQRIIHEPSIKSANPTRKPRRAGLKRMAIQRITQIIQKKSIKKELQDKYRKFLKRTRKNPNIMLGFIYVS